MKSRVLIANLDCERDFALEVEPTRDPGSFDLGPAALHTCAAVGTLMRVFATDDDRLWLPDTVNVDRVPNVEGVPANPTLETGTPTDHDDGTNVLAWGTTRATESLIRNARSATAPLDLGGPLVDTLWNLPRTTPDIAAQANDRQQGLELAGLLGCALPGAQVVTSRDALEHHLHEGGAAASAGEEWIVKSRFSTAGRWRFRGRGRSPLNARDAATVDHLFSRFGPLIFEPWMTRNADIGCTAIVTGEALCVAGFHRQDVDSQGRFRSVELLTGSPRAPWFTAREAQVFQGVVEVVGQHLRKKGYVGPFGVDAWRYEDAQGTVGFQPLGECNARMTMGLVARAWVERLLESGQLDPDTSVTLRIGKGPSTMLNEAEAVRSIPLLLPGADDEVGACLEVRSAKSPFQ